MWVCGTSVAPPVMCQFGGRQQIQYSLSAKDRLLKPRASLISAGESNLFTISMFFVVVVFFKAWFRAGVGNIDPVEPVSLQTLAPTLIKHT